MATRSSSSKGSARPDTGDRHALGAECRRRQQGHRHSGPLKRLGPPAAGHRPPGEADAVCDARKLETLRLAQFDAVYCAHNLEHYYPHDAPRVLRGFLHVLKPEGFAEIRVPDIGWVMRAAVEQGLDIDDRLYASPAGPILVRDLLYGWHVEIERTGHDFYAHKTGFTPKSLTAALQAVGFGYIVLNAQPIKFEVHLLAFAQAPTEEVRVLLGLKV